MHVTADDLVALLKSDLSASGWSGSTTPDLGHTPRQYAQIALLNSLVKKFHNGQISPELERLTLEQFLASNAACRQYVPFDQRDRVQTWDLELYNDVREILHAFCLAPRGESFGGIHVPILDQYAIFQHADLGPGASIGAKESSFFAKISESPLTATSDLLVANYDMAIRHHPTWTSSEAKRREKYGVRICRGSRLSFVPKSTKIARTICTEPILNMFFQLGIGNIIRERLRSFFGIDLSTQPDVNAHLAHFGSVTNGFATIDLKNASDTISLKLVESLFPPEFVRWIKLTRSSETTLPSGEIVQLDMVSSMGNGFTFPLQTTIFAAIVRAVYNQLGFKTSPYRAAGRFTTFSPGNFGVFGDDIIVDSRAYHRMKHALEMFGFTVNPDKSFYIGDFRESCGHDYFCGHNVRGVYISSARHELDFLSAFNRLARWSVRWETPLINLLRRLRKGFRYLPVPFDEDDIAGVKVPSSLAPVYEHGNLKRAQLRAREMGLFVYRMNKVVQRSRDIDRDGGSEASPDGALLTLLAGRLINGRVLLRMNAIKTVSKIRVTPRWDYDGNRLLTEPEAKIWQDLLLQVLSPALGR